MVMVRVLLFRIVLVASFAVGVFPFEQPFLDRNDLDIRPIDNWELADADGRILDRFDGLQDGRFEDVAIGGTKCTRYCAHWENKQPNVPDSPLINFNWAFNEGITTEKRWIDATNRMSQSRVLGKDLVSDDNQQNCMFSAIVKCATSDVPFDSLRDIFRNFYPNLQDFNNDDFTMDKLLEKRNLTSTTETKFTVMAGIRELRIVILGNITNVSLQIPAGRKTMPNLTATFQQTPELTLTKTRMFGDALVRLNVRYPSTGRWRLVLSGPNHEDYHIVVVAARAFTHQDDAGAVENEGTRKRLMNRDKSPDLFREKRSVDNNADLTYITDGSTGGRQPSISSRSSNAYSPYDPEEFDDIDEGRQETIKFPGPSSASAEVMVGTGAHNFTTRQADEPKERGISDRQSFNRDVNSIARVQNELPRKKNLVVDVNPDTNLLVDNPGSLHPVVFDVTNNHVAVIRHAMYAKSSPFTVISIDPVNRWILIAPGETIKVTVYVHVPPTATESTVNTVTLHVNGIESVEKSVQMHVRRYGSSRGIFNDARPYVTYSFNNNCAGKTNTKYCEKTQWSVDVQVQDFDSGLKLVSSNPKGIYPRTEYFSGTGSPVSFYYTNDCCNPEVEITARNIIGITNTRKIDVREWDNLSGGEIAAIVIGTLFLILLIIVIIVSIVHCMRNRKTQDLSYTHRYGSRNAPRVE